MDAATYIICRGIYNTCLQYTSRTTHVHMCVYKRLQHNLPLNNMDTYKHKYEYIAHTTLQKQFLKNNEDGFTCKGTYLS